MAEERAKMNREKNKISDSQLTKASEEYAPTHSFSHLCRARIPKKSTPSKSPRMKAKAIESMFSHFFIIYNYVGQSSRKSTRNIICSTEDSEHNEADTPSPASSPVAGTKVVSTGSTGSAKKSKHGVSKRSKADSQEEKEAKKAGKPLSLKAFIDSVRLIVISSL